MPVDVLRLINVDVALTLSEHTEIASVRLPVVVDVHVHQNEHTGVGMVGLTHQETKKASTRFNSTFGGVSLFRLCPNSQNSHEGTFKQ